MRRGITPVIATVILLMMVVAIAGAAFFWITSVQSRSQASVGTQVSSTTGRATAAVNLIALKLDVVEDELELTLHNIGDSNVVAGTIAFTISDEQDYVVKSFSSNLSSNFETDSFLTLNYALNSSLVQNETYKVKVTLPGGVTLEGSAEVAGSGYREIACSVDGDCGSYCVYNKRYFGGSCVSSECVWASSETCSAYCDGLTRYYNARCTASACVYSSASCDDSNVCTTDSCSGGNCGNVALSEQVTGCTGSSGCTTDGIGEVVCACVSGSCLDSCGDGTCDAWESQASCDFDCDFNCEEIEGSCSGVWFTGTITGDDPAYCACCEGTDEFYNSTLYCYNGNTYSDADTLENACTAWGHDWFSTAHQPATFSFKPHSSINQLIDWDFEIDPNTNVSISDGFGSFLKVLNLTDYSDSLGDNCHAGYNFTDRNNGSISFWLNLNQPDSNFGLFDIWDSDDFKIVLAYGTASFGALDIDSQLACVEAGAASQKIIGNISADEWFKVGVEWDVDSEFYNVSLNDGSKVSCGNYSLWTGDSDIFYFVSGADSASVASGSAGNEIRVDAVNLDWFNPLLSDYANYSLIDSYGGLALGDFDNDSFLDVAIANEPVSSISVFLGDGDGSFSEASIYSVPHKPMFMANGDLDGDGDLDLVVSLFEDSSNAFSVSLNNGDGSFASGVAYGESDDGQMFLELGDLDGDGDLDLVHTNVNVNSFSVWFNDGSGVFIGETKYDIGDYLGDYPLGLRLGDLDGDGDLDCITGASFDSGFNVSLNDGSGSFTVYPGGYFGLMPYFFDLGDLDGDGDLDLINTNPNFNSFNVSLNDGLGSFTVQPGGQVGTFPIVSKLADLDGDGDLDLLISNNEASSISLLLGNGDGSFSEPINYPMGNQPWYIGVGDLDLDGDSDVVVVNNDNYFSVRLNQGLNESIAPCCGDDSEDFNNGSAWCIDGDLYDCFDGDPCTIDGFNQSCINPVHADGQYTGCTGSAGCGGSVCACVSGSCSSTCGDGSCDAWENPQSCFSDCGLKSFSVDFGDSEVITQFDYVEGSSYAWGNQSTFYSVADVVIEEQEFAQLGSEELFYVFARNNTNPYDYDPYYSYFDGSEWSVVSPVFSPSADHTLWKQEGDISTPSTSGNLDLVYTNCSGGVDLEENCDLYYVNWSLSEGFSTPYQLTDFGVDDHHFNSVSIGQSLNGQYKIVAWDYSSPYTLNYTLFDGSWGEVTELTSGDYLSVNNVAINNDGEAVIAYNNQTGVYPQQFYHYNSTGWHQYGSLIDGDDNLRMELMNNDFMFITIDADTDSVNSTIFSQGEFTTLKTNVISRDLLSNGGIVLATDKGEILFFSVSSTGYYTRYYINDDWRMELNFTICGMFGCEQYERCAADCATETWCSDTVDNDGDGLVDGADPDC